LSRWLTSSVLLLISTAALRPSAQSSQPSEQTVFEVASVKPTEAIERGGGSAGLQPGGRFVLKNGPVRVLINMAFQTQTGEIVGAPDWVTYGDHYDVEARAGREISYKELGPRLQTLLADRFKLKAHLESRVRPMYELRVLRNDGKLGPQMRPSTDPACLAREESCTQRGGTGLIESNGMPMRNFVTWLPGIVGRPVLEKTGLTGRYALLLQYSQTPGSDLPSLPTALREQLGLTLEPIEASTDVIVIDHIEKPTAN
jgi:uncharacterized protein (TIGR03435 family)